MVLKIIFYAYYAFSGPLIINCLQKRLYSG